MAEYVVVGGSRKNPAIEKMNYPKASAEDKASLFLAEMKKLVLETNAAEKTMITKDGTPLSAPGGAQYIKQSKVPDIPLDFFKGRE